MLVAWPVFGGLHLGRHPGGFTANRQCIGGPALTLGPASVALQPPWVAPAAPSIYFGKNNIEHSLDCMIGVTAWH